MLTMRQLAVRALRRVGVVSEGQPTSQAYDTAVALETARDMYLSFIANGLFGPVTDVLVSADYTASENERVINTSEDDITVTLPLTVTDDSSGTRATRAPEDRAFVLVSGSEPHAHIYDADLADWRSIYDLTLDDSAPLSGRYATHLSSILAGRLCPDYGMTPDLVLTSLIQTGLASLRLKKPRRAYAEGAALRNLEQWRWC